MAKPLKHTRRLAFHLSLRHDDAYELKIAEAIKSMPRMFAKQALVNMMRKVIPQKMDEQEVYELLMDLARDERRPKRFRPAEKAAAASRPEPARQHELPVIGGPSRARLQARELVAGLA